MPYVCVAIDDDFFALEIIKDYIELEANLYLLKTFNSPKSALDFVLKKQMIDIIFIDIEMTEMSGLDLATLIRHKAQKLVFITAHTEHAINSYQMNADAFLLKPYSQQNFSQMLGRLFPKQTTEIGIKQENENFIFVRKVEEKDKLFKIFLSDIIAIEAQGRYIKFHLYETNILVHTSLSKILASLMWTGYFTRIHRSFIISINQIKAVQRSYVFLNNDLKIPIGRAYKGFYFKISKGHEV
ncbi:LytR/AlgR family response regulator transcription factor [Pedobacter nototheniae]|uniref:LytR/AlgR family response regulator transcription factor n=1 Tax=Pedobacter nototheniae TaxID=2488994 RepID=UPI00103CD84A|nr:LytTR family DNA-binding domain-containing protein [Pedobacter nototheniae]